MVLVDKDLKNNYDRFELEEMVQVALLCTQYLPGHRPKMSEVVRMLEGDGLAERWEASQRAEANKGKAHEFSSPERYSDLTDDSSLLAQAMELSGPSTKAADLTSYGVVVNSFSELENEYVGYCGKALWNKKVWTIGPVSGLAKQPKNSTSRGLSSMGCAASLSLAGSTCAVSTLMRVTKAADLTSYGVVVNSSSELENEYVGYCGKALWNKKVWAFGPVSLCNKDMLVKAARGNRAAISQHECLIWLDLRKPKSVVYVSFGSPCRLGPSQLMQIGLALEASKKPFIWVIRGVVEPKEIEKWIARLGTSDTDPITSSHWRLLNPLRLEFDNGELLCCLVVNVPKIGVDLGILRHAMWWNPVEKFDVLVTMEEISKAAERAATLALACLRADPQSRPTMWNVSHRLSVSRAPIQRASHSITFGHLLDVQV
ncbi:hypothetical protein ACLOJK_010633 [Asimina triloba]